MAASSPRIALLALLALSLTPSAAAAWTRTEVRGLRARAEIMPSGFARIGLEITVEVQGGWVEHFEIAGLGQGARLDELKAPTWIKTSAALDDTDAVPGMKYVPEIKLREDGTLTLDFGAVRRGAPKRGTFASRIVYETRLPIDQDGALLLSLPTWPSALESVELWIDAPRGTAFVPGSDADQDGVRVLEHGALTTIHIKKPQLPRTHPLEARLVLPNMMPAQPIVAQVPVERAGDAPPGRESWTIAVLLLALIALKRWSLGPAFGRGERLFSTAKAIVLVLACAAFAYAHAWAPAAGLLALLVAVALGLSLPVALHPRALSTGHRYRAVHAIDLERTRRARLLAWLGPRSWVDATTPSGLTLLTTLGALSWLAIEQSGEPQDASWLTAWAAALPLFLARTRLARAATVGDALEALGAIRAAVSTVAREHGASARLEVACASLTAPAEHARLRLLRSDEGDRELSLVLAKNSDGALALAWLITAGERTVLRKSIDPVRELPALLRPSTPATPVQPLSHAA
jgi:hypothetical protein